MKHDRIDPSCAGKTPYATKAAAIRVVEFRRKAKRLRTPKGRTVLQPYHCRNCHSWHLGSLQA